MVFIMSKCLNCGIEVTDDTRVCPLCKCIMETDPDDPGQRSYPPYAGRGMKRVQNALNIYTFCAIVAEVILVGINYGLHTSGWWSVMIGAFFVYGFITLKFSVQKHIGYQFKILLQSLLAISVVILIDYLLGFRGWSLNYVLPGAFMLIDATIVILMIVNSRNWQSYIPMQILVIVLSLLPFVLRHYGIMQDTLLSTISFGVAILVFVGSLILGGKRARDELYRRFHI